MLKVIGLEKTYKNAQRPSIKDANLTIENGVIYGFVGKNGAGKSTLIKCITGFLPFEKGDILLDSKSILKDENLVKKQIGYVPDNHATYENLTGREYVNFIADIYEVDQETREKRLKKYSKMFNIEEALDRQIKGYSHGMTQKICVIGALVHEPKLWILDEPLTGLDPQSAYQLKQAMRNHADKGNTVFFSSHILDVVENLCDRVCIIKKGTLQGVYDLKQLKADKISLEELFMKVIESED